MAEEAEDEGAGILALVGAEPKSEDSGEDESPKARAMRDMKKALDAGDFNAAGHAFQRAYDICRMKSAGPAEDEPDEDDTDEEY